MNITSRLRRILMVMLDEERVISVKNLAEKVGVSKRTVQREMELIGDSLAQYQVSFQTKTGKGVWLSGSSEDKEKLRAALMGVEDYDVSNREERRKRLILEILKEKGLKKLFYYANQFQVSEATISSDLEAVEGWLNQQNLVIKRKPGYGVMVEGTEKDYRRAIRTFIEENMDTRFLQEAYEVGEQDEYFHWIDNRGFRRILDEDILKRVVKCLSAINNKKMMSLTENSYMGLVLHVFIAISRILKNELMEQQSEWQSQMEEDEDYRLAEEIVAGLSQEFDITIPDMEVVYVCLHIKGAKHQSIEWDGGKTVEVERQELLELIDKMIRTYDETLAYAFLQDNEFVQGLLAHLQPTLIRLVYDMKISNPMLEEIKESYPEIFEKSRRAAEVLAQWVKKEVPEEEIGFLTIHFGAAQVRFEGEKENIRQVSIGIVCASGIGISRLMFSKLNKIFKERIHMETYGKNDLTPYCISRTDFFVSSISMQQEAGDILYVNPLLNQQDIEQIRQKIYHYERLPKQEEEPVFANQLEQVNHMATQIKTILRYFEVVEVSSTLTFKMLLAAIAEKMSPYQERQDMVVQALEERERLGSQIFAELGFALLHARTSGVIRPVFSIFRTTDKSAFEDAYFQEIHTAFVMLLPEDDQAETNREIFGFISSSLIEDYDFLMTALEGEITDIEKVVSKLLRKFFHQYLNQLQ